MNKERGLVCRVMKSSEMDSGDGVTILCINEKPDFYTSTLTVAIILFAHT